MRAKSYLVGFIFIVATTILILTFGDQNPKIQSLVSETHRQLKNNFQNIKEQLDGDDRKLEADERYLSLLGFGGRSADDVLPAAYPPQPPPPLGGPLAVFPDAVPPDSSPTGGGGATSSSNSSSPHNLRLLPVVVSHVLRGGGELAFGLVKNIAHYLPNHTLLLYYFDLPNSDLNLLSSSCNSTRCVLVKFDLSPFPSHVTNDKLHAFRPLIIQDALRRTGGVLYLESDQRLVTSHLEPLLTRVRVSSLLLTPRTRVPVTALTHPRMFPYFAAQQDLFYFLPMVQVARMLILNSDSVHQHVMLPWVQCALTPDCILPIGAQSEGCRFDKKPYYRYSGCHSYDVSALNIVLGLHFKFDADQYALWDSEEEVYFKSADQLLAAQDNTTDTSLT